MRSSVVCALATLTARASALVCVDTDTNCRGWAQSGECTNNPGYMLQQCRKSCNACNHHEPKREAWEAEDLSQPYANSALRDLDGAGLRALANERGPDAPVFTWFYAPWCKQCKVVRPSVEAAAQEGVSDADITYAKLDCVADVDAKKYYGVTSYPSFKVLRGKRHRWVEMPRNRTTQVIADAAAYEAQGPFVWAHSSADLTRLVYQQVPPGTDKMDAVGKGEAVAIALLSSPTGAAARAFAALASGCSARLSPMPYIAIADSTLLEAAGLPLMQPDELAVVKLFAEPVGAPEADRQVPRMQVRPLLVADDDGEDGGFDEEAEAAVCQWALANRLPLLIDFDEDPYWALHSTHMATCTHAHMHPMHMHRHGTSTACIHTHTHAPHAHVPHAHVPHAHVQGKRVDKINFVQMHALLFLSPPHADLAGVVRRAAARFARGALIVMQFMLSGMDTGGNAMFARYGVKTVLDTPRLVFLDMRMDASQNRQLVYKATISEEGVVNFLQGVGLPLESQDGSAPAIKDEL